MPAPRRKLTAMMREALLSLAGPTIRPGDPTYEEVRQIWNGMIDRHPALFARCANAADIKAAFAYARDRRLEIAIRGGGHNITGNSLADGGLVIDLSMMRRVTIDPRRRIARVQPGAQLGDIDRATQLHGLAVPIGIQSTTGIAGLTLGGGIGWLMRPYGLTCDSLRAADVVLPDGNEVRAAENANEELLWALRGGGGNFGVVTSFEFDLHPLGPTVLGGPLLFPADRAREVLAFYRDFISSARPEVGSIAGLRTAPALQWVPANVQGTPVVALMFCYAGPVEEGMELLRPFQTTLRPIAHAFGPRPFTELQAMMDSSVPAGLHYYWKSHFLPTLSDEAIETLVAHGWKKSSPMSYSLLFHMGGAIRQKSDADTAFTGRRAEHALNINGAWYGEQPQHNDRLWVRETFDAMLPFAMGVYVNFLMDEGGERVLAAYGPEKYRKLAALKARYDPSNLLHLNQNIVPAC